MITAQVELFRERFEECKPLFAGHYDEISQHKDHGFGLNPNYDEYIRREAAGELMFVTLREDSQIIGYFIGWVLRELHYQECLTLQMDIVYVSPDKRGKAGGLALAAEIESEARRRGIKAWKMGFKEEHREAMERMLLALGFAPFERAMIKWLD
jgi:GNAT superfamily N-acetyltransferase